MLIKMMKITIECRDKMLKVKGWFIANDDTICDIGEGQWW